MAYRLKDYLYNDKLTKEQNILMDRLYKLRITEGSQGNRPADVLGQPLPERQHIFCQFSAGKSESRTFPLTVLA